MPRNNLAVHFSSVKQDWETPDDLFQSLNAEFGPFQLDVCASVENTKVKVFYAEAANSLIQNWNLSADGKTKCWMNPPYGREISKWVKKAYEESQKGSLVVALLPARTDTRWFHDYCYNSANAEIRFLRGRVKFVGATASAPFPSMIVIFRPPQETAA